ncbi:MAG: hypothetical protein O2U61_03825 [Candidatus Bathyarchaeota archaeon]|nr:hypothetical protein [Candidatus Bathyarchaeota archaeon]
MEDILRDNNLKFPEIKSGMLTSFSIYISPEGTDKLIPASWGYVPSGISGENNLDLPKREKVFKVDYLNLKNLPFASHKQAGYCKIWVWDKSKARAVRGFYFQDLDTRSYTVCLITDNSNLIYI